MDLEPFVSAFGILATLLGATWYLGSLISSLRTEVRGSREDVAELRDDVQGLRQDLAGLRGDVFDAKAEIRALDQRVSAIEGKARRHRRNAT